MAGDDMAAQFVADLQRAFEVNARSNAPCARRGQPQGLGACVDVKECASCRRLYCNHGETGAVAGDRGAEGDGFRRIATSDAQTP